jgi:hypothetical protein
VLIAPVRRENAKEFETVFAIAEAVMGFVPNSMLIMARDPALLAAFSETEIEIASEIGQLTICWEIGKLMDTGLPRSVYQVAIGRRGGVPWLTVISDG